MHKALLVDLPKFVGDAVRIVHAYRQENEVLKMMLVERGLTVAKIRLAVKRHLKHLEPHEEASAQFDRVLREMQRRLAEEDPLTQIAKTLPEKDKNRMS